MNDTDKDNRPLLLVDIDGVLNLFGAWVSTGKVWWDTKGRMRQSTVAPEHLREDRARGYSLLFNPEHPEMFSELEQHFDTVWATMWMDSAWQFGEKAGFGTEWDFIDFEAFRPMTTGRQMTGNGVGSFKHPGIVDTLGDRPGIWVDDDMTPFQHEWAQKRTEAGIPTLFIQPDPEFGMTREHFEQILEFAESLKVDSMAS